MSDEAGPVPDRPALRLVKGRDHDLPPLWDGHKVTWGEWTHSPSSAPFHLPASEWACPRCGLLEEPLTASGTFYPAPGETVLVQRPGAGVRGRRVGHPSVPVQARPYLRFVAFRCPGCLADRVYDHTTGQEWDLDETDYQAEGSWPVGTLW